MVDIGQTGSPTLKGGTLLMMHCHAQLYTGWTKGGGYKRKKEDMGQTGGHRDKAK